MLRRVTGDITTRDPLRSAQDLLAGISCWLAREISLTDPIPPTGESLVARLLGRKQSHPFLHISPRTIIDVLVNHMH